MCTGPAAMGCGERGDPGGLREGPGRGNGRGKGANEAPRDVAGALECAPGMVMYPGDRRTLVGFVVPLVCVSVGARCLTTDGILARPRSHEAVPCTATTLASQHRSPVS